METVKEELKRFINEDLSHYKHDKSLADEYIIIVQDWIERIYKHVNKLDPDLELVLSSGAIMDGRILTYVDIDYFYKDNEIVTLQIDLDPTYDYYQLFLYSDQTYETEEERIIAERNVVPQSYKKGDEEVILNIIVDLIKLYEI